MTPAEIVEFVRARVRAHQRRYLHLQDADIDDLVQDVSVALWRWVPRFDATRGCKLNTFLDRRCNGAILDWLRLRTGFKRRTRPPANEPLREFSCPHDGPMSEAMRAEDNVRLVSALGRLSPNERDVVEARLRGALWSDIGRDHGFSESRACQLGARAQRKLAAQLQLAEVT